MKWFKKRKGIYTKNLNLLENVGEKRENMVYLYTY